jgi:hypothetical protein
VLASLQRQELQLELLLALALALPLALGWALAEVRALALVAEVAEELAQVALAQQLRLQQGVLVVLALEDLKLLPLPLAPLRGVVARPAIETLQTMARCLASLRVPSRVAQSGQCPLGSLEQPGWALLCSMQGLATPSCLD